MTFNITRCAHAELRVTDLARARAFYVDALGLLEIDHDDESVYLGALEERDQYCLRLRRAESAGVGHLAFRVAAEADLDALYARYAAAGRPTRWVPAERAERGQGRALRVQDPSGLPIEFFHTIAQRERRLQHFHAYRGAHVMRLDHFNCQVPVVQTAFEWWTQQMGFYLSEYTVSDPPGPERLWAAWLHRKQNVHDLALMNGVGPRLHHVGLWLADTHSVLRACDILAALGMAGAIERGPGRHGLSNAFFLYLRDPDGNRIELYTSDYLIPDPDFQPLKWTLSDPRRATFWGHYAPKSWFDEASPCEDILTGALLPTQAPVMAGTPDFAT